MRRLSSPDVPLVEANLKGDRQKPTLIALQCSFTATEKNNALGIAHAWHVRECSLTTHYVVDAGSKYRCVPDDIVAPHMSDSRKSIGVMLCDDPSESDSRWDERDHEAMLSSTADIVAQLCLAYGIKPRLLTEPEFQKWRKWRLRRRGGIIVHGHMAEGYWPSAYFLTLVEVFIEKHKLIQAK